MFFSAMSMFEASASLLLRCEQSAAAAASSSSFSSSSSEEEEEEEEKAGSGAPYISKELNRQQTGIQVALGDLERKQWKMDVTNAGWGVVHRLLVQNKTEKQLVYSALIRGPTLHPLLAMAASDMTTVNFLVLGDAALQFECLSNCFLVLICAVR